tara:strand:- start:127 stop:1215 length:1089 start_codon:yes stop_codon:yes gene_type:complete
METMGLNTVNPSFWNNKKVLITGNTGFKGSWMNFWLTYLGAEVCGYSLPLTEKNILYKSLCLDKETHQVFGDINDYEFLSRTISSYEPEIIFHMAAQPLVRESYKNPLHTINTNVLGTANLLESLKESESTRVIVVITSDKCYENFEKDDPYKEDEPMGGYDPYSASKGCAEIITSSYRRSFFFCDSSASVSSVRAGNVIGGGDWSSDRLIPDSIKSFISKKPVSIRFPNAIRPWQDVLDPISGYLKLAEKQWENKQKFSDSWNFGPDFKSEQPVSFIMDLICKYWGNKSEWIFENNNDPHEAGILKLDSSKSRNQLNWTPQKDIETTIKDLVLWYKSYGTENNMIELSTKYIQKYMPKNGN